MCAISVETTQQRLPALFCPHTSGQKPGISLLRRRLGGHTARPELDRSVTQGESGLTCNVAGVRLWAAILSAPPRSLKSSVPSALPVVVLSTTSCWHIARRSMCHLSAVDPLDEGTVGLRHWFAGGSPVSSNGLNGSRSTDLKMMTSLASAKSYLARASGSALR